jgi:hypothetical protein
LRTQNAAEMVRGLALEGGGLGDELFNEEAAAHAVDCISGARQTVASEERNK